MLNFKTGSALPSEIIAMISEHHQYQDFSFVVTTSPIIILIGLSGIHQEEVKTIKEKSFEFGVSIVEDIPFITMDFGNGLYFDTAVYNMEDCDIYSNAINIISLDSDNYEIKSIRVIGADMEQVTLLRESVAKIMKDKQSFERAAILVQQHFTTQQIHQRALIKQYAGVKEN